MHFGSLSSPEASERAISGNSQPAAKSSREKRLSPYILTLNGALHG